MDTFEVPEVDYTQYTNRQLAAVPLAVLAVALVILLGWYVAFGTPVSLSNDFTGGAELRVQTTMDKAAVADAFSTDPTSIQQVRGDTSGSKTTYIVTFPPSDISTLKQQARSAGMDVASSSSTSPTFGAETQTIALYGVVAAFVGMSVIAFVLFRTFVPSIAIVISAFSDVMIPLALMNVFGIQLSLGTVAALLMLIGYSVDSDILLNNHILRRSGEFYESTARAMRTGVTMTLTSIAAMAVMAAVAAFYGIELMTSIGLVLVFGLTADLMNTYMLNLSLLRWYKFEGVAK